MATLIEAFGADDVICKDLLLCGFSSAKPLLKLIVDANLFETIKSPSGLVGLL